ncbi:hypothetical protein Q8W71_22985 [Methylobacterium sp. NEAU 140]|uniref:hypothetical protein n=1 Tax=Methylobacterium sp. NEAU 140 TaxID=3064945 RepID=UPI00273372D2|nr:hypothetical protein [Methylobacterium sp. NEAU 140]MDP4025503.1 hypothetical protein [Methylobacterium sp. NEAU 140]
MQDTTKMPAWLARRGYSARLKQRLAQGGRQVEEPAQAAPRAPEAATPARPPGGIILPFPARGRRALLG